MLEELELDLRGNGDEESQAEISKKYKVKCNQLSKQLGIVVGQCHINSASYQKSYLMKSFRALLQEELGEEHYKDGDDIENLLQYALQFGAPMSAVSITPKGHSTGMRLISILSLNLVLMTSTLENIMSCYNE